MSHSTAHRLSNLHRHLQSHHSPLSHEEKASRENSYCSVRPPISLKGGNRTRRTSTRNQLCHLNLHNRHIYIPSKRHAAAGCGYNTCLRHAAANKGALHNMLAATPQTCRTRKSYKVLAWLRDVLSTAGSQNYCLSGPETRDAC